jgi:cyclopropane fatty-acyl-phospholipid synthase-like methyltransferase
LKQYNEVEYWSQRENPSAKNLPPWQWAFIASKMKGVETVLDFGAGVGRTFCCYRDAYEVTACDISPNYMKACLEAAGSEKFRFKYIVVGMNDVKSRLPFKEYEFQRVVASEVFLHMKPEYIGTAMKELARVGRKVVAISPMHTQRTYDNGVTEYTKDQYCFNYDFERLAEENDLKIYSIEYHGLQAGFVYGKEEF